MYSFSIVKKIQGQSDSLIGDGSRFIRQTVTRLPFIAESGQGSWLVDKNKKRYLDFFTGHGVMCLGHNHPVLKAAMKAQLEKLVHTGNHFHLEPQIRLAQKLSAAFGGGRVFFANSGAEIVELAIKLCRRFRQTASRPQIICMNGSFHGRTYGALTATGQKKFKRRLGPFLPGFASVPFNDSAALEHTFGPSVCGVLVEPVQGEGGVVVASGEFLKTARCLCDRHGALLVFDEIQTGLGRTGSLFAFTQFKVRPDVLLLAKPLGGGLPLSALVTSPRVANCLGVGDHGSTFGGNPVASAAGCALLDILNRKGFLARVKKKGELVRRKLTDLKKQFPALVKDIRGRGLLLGMELFRGAGAVFDNAIENGLIINNPTGEVLRFLPPYTVTEDEIEDFAERLKRALKPL